MSMRTAREPQGTNRTGWATYGMVNDENTGLHSTGADQCQLQTGGTAAVTVDSSQVVNIAAGADKLKVNSVIVPQAIEVVFHAQAAAAMVDQSFFLANRAYQVTVIKFVHAVAEATAGTLLVQVTKDTSTDAPGAGANLLTNNASAGFNCKSTANTVQAGTLTATGADLLLAAGDRLSVDFTAAATELVGVTVSVTLVPV